MNEDPRNTQQEPKYTHRDWSPAAQPPPQPNSPQPPRPMTSYQPKKKTSVILPVLVSVLLTFVLTVGTTWALASRGVLPGTAKNDPAIGETRSTDDPTVEPNLNSFSLDINIDDPEAQQAANKLQDALDLLEDNYYKVLSPEELLDAMTEGVINSMDSQYTYYMSAEDYSAFAESMSGNYSGIGATVTQLENGSFQIVSVVPNGPAELQGLLPLDLVLEVDGKPTTEFATTTELATAVRGQDGTNVELLILRDAEEMTFVVTRAQVVVEQVHTRMLNDTLGYMYISEFASNLPEQFIPGIEQLVEEGAQNIVFDLRGNPGGSAQALIESLDILLPEGIIATTRGRESGEIINEAWTSDAATTVPDSMRYAILVNEHTASAAELFSGALRDYDKAVLIGSTTYGKGSGTRSFLMEDGSAANITIFNYYLPDGDLIEGIGLAPTIEAEAIPTEFLRIPQYQLTPEQDPALQAAIDYFDTNESLRAE